MEPMKKSFAKLKTVSILSLLFLVGCGCFPKPPLIKPKQIVQRLNLCNQYVVEFKDELTLRFEQTLPLSECIVDGHFVLSDTEILALRRAYRDAKQCHDKRTCKTKKVKTKNVD